VGSNSAVAAVLGGPAGPAVPGSRQVVEGIVWRDLPESFGPWQTVWKRHHRFAVDGTWEKVLARVLTDADAAGELDWALSVDSTIARVHQHGATATRTQGARPV
jgi:transposase